MPTLGDLTYSTTARRDLKNGKFNEIAETTLVPIFRRHSGDRSFSDRADVSGCATLSSSRLRRPGRRHPSMDRSRGPPRQAILSLVNTQRALRPRAQRTHVRSGSKADILLGRCDVRFTLESGHWDYSGRRRSIRLHRDQKWSSKCGAPHEDIQNARRIIGQGQGCIDRRERLLRAARFCRTVGNILKDKNLSICLSRRQQI
jgi:hypothetical protein